MLLKQTVICSLHFYSACFLILQILSGIKTVISVFAGWGYNWRQSYNCCRQWKKLNLWKTGWWKTMWLCDIYIVHNDQNLTQIHVRSTTRQLQEWDQIFRNTYQIGETIYMCCLNHRTTRSWSHSILVHMLSNLSSISI